MAENKILIVYLSRTENTAVLANIIREQVGGRLERVETDTPYPADYDEIVAKVAKENETGYLPPLRTDIKNIRTYDIVFVGFPTWGMQLPSPIKSFLKGHDLSGKAIVPFNTHGGYGSGSSFRSIEQLCPNSTVLEGISIRGGLERDGIRLAIDGNRRGEVAKDVADWLRRIRLVNATVAPSQPAKAALALLMAASNIRTQKMKVTLSIVGLVLVLFSATPALTQTPTAEQQLIQLSRDKWQWMAQKDVDKLGPLFHDKSKFVHMSGTWKKAEELDIIKTGRIWYRQTDVHDVAAEVVENTGIVWSRITLNAMVRGTEAATEFTVTEVYQKQEENWKLLALTFSSVRDTHRIEK